MHNILVGQPEERRPLRRSMNRCEDIKMDVVDRMRGCGLDSSGSGLGLWQVAANSNDLFGSIQGGERLLAE
jgi:hypothetical protein